MAERSKAVKQLRAAVAGNWDRVTDVFKAWDENGDGQLSRTEFCKVIAALGEMSKTEAAALFDQLDTDQSGELDFNELNKALRAGADIELDAALQDGAVEIETSRSTKFALRTEIQKTHSRVLGTLELGAGDTIMDKIRNALAASFSRIRELWVEWDDDGSGSIDKTELFRALTLLGLEVTRGETDDLFESLDADSSGTIEFEELKRALHSSATVELDAALRAGAVAFEMDQKNKFALRKHGPGKTGSNVANDVKLEKGASAVTVVEQLRASLTANLTRTIDLFREWDADNSGSVDKEEFHRALGLLGMQASKAESDELFDSLDDDRSGTIEFGELHAKLRRGGPRAEATTLLPRFYRGPVTARDTLVQMLPRLGARLIAALNTAHADEEDPAKRGFVTSKHFVQALDSLAPLTTTGREDGQMLTVQGKKLHDELHGIFSELVVRHVGQPEDDEQPRLPVKSILRQLRALGKEGEASTAGVMQRGAAAMASGTGPILPASAPPNVRALFAAAVRSGLTMQLFQSWDTQSTGMIGKEAFRRALATLHISAAPREADAIFAALDATGTGTLAYAELGVALHKIEPKPRVVNRKSKKTPKRSPRIKNPSARSSYVTEMIDTLGEAYFLPAVADATHPSTKAAPFVKISPRVHERVRPHTIKENTVLPEIPTPRTTEKSPEKSPRRKAAMRDRAETVLPRDPLTGEMPKPSPRSPPTKRKATKTRRPSGEGATAAGEEGAEYEGQTTSLPAVSPRHAKLLAKASGDSGAGGATPRPTEPGVPWRPTGRSKRVPEYKAHEATRARIAPKDVSQAPLDPEAIALEKEKERRDRQARNQANERVRLVKAQERIKELEQKLQELAPEDDLGARVPFMRGGVVIKPNAPSQTSPLLQESAPYMKGVNIS